MFQTDENLVRYVLSYLQLYELCQFSMCSFKAFKCSRKSCEVFIAGEYLQTVFKKWKSEGPRMLSPLSSIRHMFIDCDDDIHSMMGSRIQALRALVFAAKKLEFLHFKLCYSFRENEIPELLAPWLNVNSLQHIKIDIPFQKFEIVLLQLPDIIIQIADKASCLQQLTLVHGSPFIAWSVARFLLRVISGSSKISHFGIEHNENYEGYRNPQKKLTSVLTAFENQLKDTEHLSISTAEHRSLHFHLNFNVSVDIFTLQILLYYCRHSNEVTVTLQQSEWTEFDDEYEQILIGQESLAIYDKNTYHLRDVTLKSLNVCTCVKQPHHICIPNIKKTFVCMCVGKFD